MSERADGRAVRVRQILVAGIGNTWMRDDGFGGEVAGRLAARELPDGVTVFDAGTGGLALAYEVMRGYDALVLVDASRQGGDPGTLYVMEVSEGDVEGSIDDGTPIDPHGMDPATVLRFIRGVGGWPGKVVIVACEPAAGDEMGIGLSDPVAAALEPAVELVVRTVGELGRDEAYAEPAR